MLETLCKLWGKVLTALGGVVLSMIGVLDGLCCGTLVLLVVLDCYSWCSEVLLAFWVITCTLDESLFMPTNSDTDD